MWVRPSLVNGLIVCGAAALAAVSAGRCSPGALLSAEPATSAPTILRVRVAGNVAPVPLEEYVLGSILTEVSPVDEEPRTVARIFEVQAVLARTYALSHAGRHATARFDLCDTTHCQLYQPARIKTSRFVAAARSAVSATRGQTIMFGSHVARTTFHADCGGHTSAGDVVWRGDALPYLSGSPDEVPDVSHRSWRFDVSIEQLRAALNAEGVTSVGSRLHAISVPERDPGGRALLVELRGTRTKSVSGETFRRIVNAVFGPKALQSTRFGTVRTDDGFLFEGTGYGHGVGLCQVGAAARARRGDPLADILLTYFPGTRLSPRTAR